MSDPLVLFGVEIGGEVPDDAIATAVVVLVEVIEGEESKPHLRLLSSDMPIWRRIGILETLLTSDRLEAARSFENDEDSDA